MRKQPFYDEHKCPEVEKLNVGEVYAITLNPPDTLAPHNDPLLPYSNFLKEVNRIYAELITKCKHSAMILYPELSHKGRLHFHGYLQITNVIAFMLNDLLHLRSMCHFEIDTISYEEIEKADGDTSPPVTGAQVYDKYIRKQLHLIAPLFKSNRLSVPLQINDLNPPKDFHELIICDENIGNVSKKKKRQI